MPGTTTQHKVQFGLSNVHYAVYDPEDGTYGTPKPWPGAVSMTINAEGSQDKHYADNVVWFVGNSNSGYSGSVEMRYMDDDTKVDLLNYKKGANGVVYEDTQAFPPEVALMYEINGNIEQKRYTLYNVTFSRPGGDHSTTEDSVTPTNAALDFTAAGRDFDGVGNVTIGHVSSDDNAYDTYFDAVTPPTAPAAVPGGEG